MSSLEALKKAVAEAGSQAALGEICGVKQQAVWHWLHKSQRCPAEAVLPIEVATGVSRHDLRPDLYPAPQSGVAA